MCNEAFVNAYVTECMCQDGNTALIFAARGGFIKVAELPLDHGANIKKINNVRAQHVLCALRALDIDMNTPCMTVLFRLEWVLSAHAGLQK